MIGLVEEGHPNAVIFANRTQNADRGYNERLIIESKETSGGSRTNFNIADLDLDVPTLKKIQIAIQKWKREHPEENESTGMEMVPVKVKSSRE